MKEYESPRFDFEELKLFERVADECWGTASIWLDTNNDSIITGADIQLTTGGGCKGNESAGHINDAIKKYNNMVAASNGGQNLAIVAQYNPELADYLFKNPGSSLTNITATATSNWANTKESSGGGIIIDKS